MAEEDNDQKTEQPTEKRIREAREKGQLPISREMTTWFLFIATLVVIAWLSPGMGRDLAVGMRIFLEMPHGISLEGGGLQKALADVLAQVGIATVLVFSLLAGSVIAGTMLQTGLYFNTERLEIDFKRIMPNEGLKRLFSTASLVELAKSFVKLVVIGFVVFLVFRPIIGELRFFIGRDLFQSVRFMHREAIHLIVVMMLVITVIAVTDLLYQRFRYFRNLRMTKQEVKDEHKQLEGDPLVKSRLRSIRLERARKRMIAAVPKADVVITNPTHYAVALLYDNAKMAAPTVVAKGINLVAERIRKVAADHNVPLVSNPPLARALYETVEIDEMIRPEQYRAVAEVISYVYRLRKKAV